MQALSEGERDILRELAADADGWMDAADECADSEEDILAELRADLDAARDNERRRQEHEREATAVMMAAEATQAAVWHEPPY